MKILTIEDSLSPQTPPVAEAVRPHNQRHSTASSLSNSLRRLVLEDGVANASMTTARGLTSSRIRMAAGKRLRSSSCPSCFPATEKGGQEEAIGEYVRSLKWPAVEVIDVSAQHPPLWAIQDERIAGIGVDFDQANVLKPSISQIQELDLPLPHTVLGSWVSLAVSSMNRSDTSK